MEGDWHGFGRRTAHTVPAVLHPRGREPEKVGGDSEGEVSGEERAEGKEEKRLERTKGGSLELVLHSKATVAQTNLFVILIQNRWEARLKQG
eukprot:1404781-Rhodomonas_salina.1